MKHLKFLSFRIIAIGLIVLSMASCNDMIKKEKKETDSNAKITLSNMTLDQQDFTFMTKAEEINLEEIKLGKLAQDKSDHKEIDQFAEMLITDHNLLQQDLSSLALKKATVLPDRLNSDAQKAYTTLKDLSGQEFDKKYTELMVNGHKQAISLFEKDSSRTKDADVRAYATIALPILRKHLTRTQTIKDNLKKSK